MINYRNTVMLRIYIRNMLHKVHHVYDTKKAYIQIGYILFIVCWGVCVRSYAQDQQHIFHQHGKVTPLVQEIFKLLNHPVDTLTEANEWAQQHLLRVGERWDTQPETNVHKLIFKHEDDLCSILRDLGFIDQIMPQYKHYFYALIMGGFRSRIDERLEYLNTLLHNGHIFDTIVLLSGARQLRDEEKDNLPNHIETEAEMTAYLFNNHASLKDKKYMLVDAPTVSANGTLRRPTTDDTLRYFLRAAQTKSNCLVISNNPYVIRQTKVTQRILPQDAFPTEGAGASTNLHITNIVMIMDEFARTLYEEHLTHMGNKPYSTES